MTYLNINGCLWQIKWNFLFFAIGDNRSKDIVKGFPHASRFYSGTWPYVILTRWSANYLTSQKIRKLHTYIHTHIHTYIHTYIFWVRKPIYQSRFCWFQRQSHELIPNIRRAAKWLWGKKNKTNGSAPTTNQVIKLS